MSYCLKSASYLVGAPNLWGRFRYTLCNLTNLGAHVQHPFAGYGCLGYSALPHGRPKINQSTLGWNRTKKVRIETFVDNRKKQLLIGPMASSGGNGFLGSAPRAITKA